MNHRRNPNLRSSIYKGADGSWHGRVTVGVRDDGRPDRRHVRAKTRSEVTKKVRKLEQDRDAGRVRKVGERWRVSDWLTHWLNNIVVPPRVTVNTDDGYRINVEKHLIPGVRATRSRSLLSHLNVAECAAQNWPPVSPVGSSGEHSLRVAHQLLGTPQCPPKLGGCYVDHAIVRGVLEIEEDLQVPRGLVTARLDLIQQPHRLPMVLPRDRRPRAAQQAASAAAIPASTARPTPTLAEAGTASPSLATNSATSRYLASAREGQVVDPHWQAVAQSHESQPAVPAEALVPNLGNPRIGPPGRGYRRRHGGQSAHQGSGDDFDTEWVTPGG